MREKLWRLRENKEREGGRKVKKRLPEREEREESSTAAHHRAVTQSHVSTIEQGKSGTPDFPPLYHPYFHCFSIVRLLLQHQILQGWISHASGVCFQRWGVSMHYLYLSQRFYGTFKCVLLRKRINQVTRSVQMC